MLLKNDKNNEIKQSKNDFGFWIEQHYIRGARYEFRVARKHPMISRLFFLETRNP
jgi:hypothetical protein